MNAGSPWSPWSAGSARGGYGLDRGQGVTPRDGQEEPREGRGPREVKWTG